MVEAGVALAVAGGDVLSPVARKDKREGEERSKQGVAPYHAAEYEQEVAHILSAVCQTSGSRAMTRREYLR